MAAERSLERIGTDRFDVLLLHNPDRTGYESEEVWDGMAALRDEGLADSIGVAPGPANGFTLDLIGCLERFGDRIDWAMVILNPFEPWPGELVPGSCRARRGAGDHARGRLRRAPLGRRASRHRARRGRSPCPSSRRLDRSRPRQARPREADLRAHRPHADAARMPVEPRSSGGRMRRADPDPGGGPRGAADRGQASGARGSCRTSQALSAGDIDEIRAIGDNRGSMALKGAHPDHEGDERPDRWALSPELAEAGRRWEIDPERDLAGKPPLRSATGR